MRKQYQIAGLNLQVDAPCDYADTQPLCLFQGNFTHPDVQYRLFMTDALPQVSGRAYCADGLYVICTEDKIYRYLGVLRGDLSSAYLCSVYRKTFDHRIEIFFLRSRVPQLQGALVFNGMCLEHVLSRYAALILHAAYIQTEKGAVVFTAPSGTGKSTQAELWRKYAGARIINGDRVILRCSWDGWYAHGLPSAGSSVYCENVCSPLRAVVALSQGKENYLQELHGYQAFQTVLRGAWLNQWDSDDRAALTQNIGQLVTKTRVLALACLPDCSAVTLLASTLDRW